MKFSPEFVKIENRYNKSVVSIVWVYYEDLFAPDNISCLGWINRQLPSHKWYLIFSEAKRV